MSKQIKQQSDAVDTSTQVRLQSESKSQLKFPRIYTGPNLTKVGLRFGQVYSGPDYPVFVKELMTKAPTLASMIFPVNDIKTIPDAVVKTFLSQIK